MFEIVEASKIVNLMNETATARKTHEIAAMGAKETSKVDPDNEITTKQT